MVTVSVSETFDLSTKLGKMTLIGIHTPKKEIIQKMYPGFAMQYKYFKINSVSVIMAGVTGNYAVSPQDIGTAGTQIAPEDMMNPILYKAVSNNSWSTMEARLAGLGYQISHPSGNAEPKIVGDMAFTEDDSVAFAGDQNDEFGVYYSLLADPQGFRLSHISKGVQMKSLRPLVYEKWYSHGVNDAHGIIEKWNGDTSSYEKVEIPPREFLGKAHRMPKINTTYLTGLTGTTNPGGENQGTEYQFNGIGNGNPRNVHCQMPEVEPVMCGMVILPPCRRTKMYYRLVVRASISFFGKRPMTDVASFGQMDNVLEPLLYHSDYADQSSRMKETTDFVDISEGDITKIMEGH